MDASCERRISLKALDSALRRPVFLTFGLVAVVLLALISTVRDPRRYTVQPLRSLYSDHSLPKTRDCFAYNEPGLLHFDILDPSQTRYDTLNSSCRARNDLVPRFLHRQEVDYLRNKTVLVLGDSIDRGLVVYLGETPGAVHTIRSELDPDEILEPNGDVKRNGLPRHTYIPDLDFTISNFFLYGLDERGLWSSHPSFSPPFQLSERWKLVESNLRGRRDPDLVILQAGVWDLGRYQNPLVQPSEHTDQWQFGLDPAFLEQWMDEASDFIDHARKVFPSSQVYWRIIHDASAPLQFFGARPNCIHPLRIEQLRQAQKKVLREKEVPAIPLGVVLQNQPFEYRPDGLHLGPAADALYAEMLFAALRAL